MQIKENISATIEERIVAGLILDTEFAKVMVPILYEKEHLIKFNALSSLARLCTDYYIKHKEAPRERIDDLVSKSAAYNMFKITEKNFEDIDNLVGSLTENYHDFTFGEYVQNQCFAQLTQRTGEVLANNIQVLAEKGDIEQMLTAIKDFKTIGNISIEADMLRHDNPEEAEERNKELHSKETGFMFPGDYGKFVGLIKRNSLIAYLAPQKRGKTFLLVNAYKSGIEQKLNTVFFSAEMGKKEIEQRAHQAFFPMMDSDDSGEYTFPEFDCVLNQTQNCADAPQQEPCSENGELIPVPDHECCTKCRKGNKAKYLEVVYQSNIHRDFVRDTYFKNITKNDKTSNEKYKRMNKYGRMFAPTSYSLSVEYMEEALQYLEDHENFIPDMIILDYIDITNIRTSKSEWQEIDEKWMQMKAFAKKYNCIVIVATQGNKEAISAEILTQEHQSGFYGKGRHVDMTLGINQTPDEKKEGIIRINIIEKRAGNSYPTQCCKLLTDFRTGQAHLDSYFSGFNY